MTVKVGQVYRWVGDNSENCYNLVITRVSEDEEYCDYIYNDGQTVAEDDVDFVIQDKQLIASYPTWIEAVCSHYFSPQKENIGEL